METLTSTILILVAIIGTSVISAIIAKRVIHEKLQMAIDSISDILIQVFEKPAVSRAMSVIGKEGGAARTRTAVGNHIATDILNSPKFAGLKMAASALGMNVDQYIDEHGAVETLEGIQGLGDMFGFNVQSLLSGEVNLGNLAVGHEANGRNPYLK